VHKMNELIEFQQVIPADFDRNREKITRSIQLENLKQENGRKVDNNKMSSRLFARQKNEINCKN